MTSQSGKGQAGWPSLGNASIPLLLLASAVSLAAAPAILADGYSWVKQTTQGALPDMAGGESADLARRRDDGGRQLRLQEGDALTSAVRVIAPCREIGERRFPDMSHRPGRLLSATQA